MLFCFCFGLLHFGPHISWQCRSLDLDMLEKFVRVITIREDGSSTDNHLNRTCSSKESSFGMRLLANMWSSRRQSLD